MASAGVNAQGIDRQIDALLCEVRNQFEMTISENHLKRFQEGSEMKLKLECVRIQRNQERGLALTNLRRIEQFFFRVKELQVLIGELCNIESYVAHIWGAMQFLLSTANSTLTGGWDGLLSAYETLGKSIPVLEGLQPLSSETIGLGTCLVAIYSDLLDFHSGAYRCFTQFSEKGRKKIFNSAWDDFKNNDLSYLETKMERHKSILDCLRNRLPIDYGRLRDYKNNREKEEQEHNRKVSECRKAQFKEAQQWILDDGDTSDATHTRLCDERKVFDSTCDWINGIESVDNWLNEPVPIHPVLWMNGSMGSGKSILASYLIEECRELTSTQDSFKATYFYCKEGNPQATTFLSICRGLLHRQMMHIAKDERFTHLIAYCCEKKGNSGQSQLSLQDAESLLKTFFDIIPNQFIIVDGLDECDKAVTRETLKTLSAAVMQQDALKPGCLRLLIISREQNDIKRILSTEAVNAGIFNIKAKDNENAVRLYVDLRLTQFNPAFQLSNGAKQQIKIQTFEAAKATQGMFLFARLTLDHLEQSKSRSDLLRKLEKERLPTSIPEAYDCLLESLKNSLITNGNEEPWNKAKSIFGWLACAERTLHWHELRAIASTERYIDSVELQDRRLIDDIQLCGTLVHMGPDKKVEFMHHTARRFILESHHVDKQEIMFDLASSCMQYLTFPCFGEDISESQRKDFANKGAYAFQDYAISKWSHHIEAVLQIQDPKIDELKSEHFAKILRKFTDRYCKSLDNTGYPSTSAAGESSQANLDEVKEQARIKCARLEGKPCYDLLLNLWINVTKQRKEGNEGLNKPCLKALEDVLIDNRKAIEELAEANGPERCHSLYEFYGNNLCKCSRLLCEFFHKGLPDQEQLKRHMHQHQRPFFCSVPDCNLGKDGFILRKDLEKHMRNHHSNLADGPNPFPERNNRQNNEARFACSLCPKRFTRKINLDGHTRSHFGERPYSCQFCSKKFTRLNDLRRHEKLHLRK